MPASISAAVPEVGISADGQEEYYDFLREMGVPIEQRGPVDEDSEEEEEKEEVEDWEECNEFAFLPGSREDKDGDTQEPLVSSSDEKPGSPSSAACRSKKRAPASVGRPVRLLLLAGAAGLSAIGHKPTSIQNEFDEPSNYEFKPDGQKEYFDFLRGMGCEFPQYPSHEEGEDEFEDENQLEDEVDPEFSADGQEEYYDFLREMGVPIEQRGPGDEDSDEEEEEKDEEEEEEVEDWDGSEEWFEGKTSHPIGAAHANAVEKNEMPANGVNSFENSQPSYDDDFTKRPFRPIVSIAPGPSLCLQKALLNVAAERTAIASMERSWEIINRM